MYTVSYSGVHQAFQLALAAQEAQCLDRFLCSFYDAPGKWGRWLSLAVGVQQFSNRRLVGVDPRRVIEYPWPELIYKGLGRFKKLPTNAWIQSAQAFDRWAARQLASGESRGVVCTENCAFETFQAAETLGMHRIYDCPGHNAQLWQEATAEAARRTGLPSASIADTAEISRRKKAEIELADVVLTYSEFHTAGVVARGVPREHIAQIPLWTDTSFWRPTVATRSTDGPLKILFAGGINLRKGVPFLIEAVRSLAPHAVLTLVGKLDPDVKPCLSGTEAFASVLRPVSKQRLLAIYHNHDVLVLPSLGDSFGFVALEAMACALPVIVTTHCGAPVPDSTWRVPVMDSQAISNKLAEYCDDREKIVANGMIARRFAEAYTPSRYRRSVSGLLTRVASRKS